MAEVSNRPASPHHAAAEAEVVVAQETLSAIIDGAIARGDVLSVAELAGVMAGKRTSDLIPLCHPVALTDLLVRAVPDRAAGVVRIRVETATIGPSGVEMEALTAAAVAALTVYDMVREMDRSVTIRAVRLQRPDEPVSGPPPRAPRGARVAGRIAGAPPRGSFGGRVPPRRHGS